jgi:hypothetical protein
MAWVRCVTEMGMEVDVHGLDYTAIVIVSMDDGK